MEQLSGEQILKLGDEDLRELVFRLCEAELRRNSLPISSLTAGGNQTAGDGGIDVRVEAANGATLDFIKRADTGFQVKAEDMPVGKIGIEMRPGGTLRPSIQELIDRGGAYIIVTSKGSVADGPLRNRRQAMREAVADAPGQAELLVDCYDRDRLATWVRTYPGIEMWVRSRILEPLDGWEGYGNWTSSVAVGAYLTDDFGRVIAKTSGNAEAMPAAQAIDLIRTTLSGGGGVVRLVGLSGTGKTRFVQALFEEGVGTTASLDKAIALYTDQGRGPRPSAREMMIQLGAEERRTVVVVDNCNPETHRSLTGIAASNAKYLSLITVEYDVADDEPEDTSVYELTASSPNVLEKIIGRLAPQVNDADRRRIVEFAGGNARIALALAKTLQKGETLGVLNDSDLFRRLFLQGNTPDESLLRAAEVMALVYSFDGIDLDSEESELNILASIAGLQPNELFRHVSELRRRDLVQKRSRWRAVLPHALANRLAKQALTNLPPNLIVGSFVGHNRLLRSFSRRLGYLHDCQEACDIATRWIADEKWLASPATLTELGLNLFLNLAPLVPEKALDTIEKEVFGAQGDVFTAASWPSRSRWISLTHSLAYEVAHFERAARIILKYAEMDDSGRGDHGTWTEIFHVALSGVLAPAPLRIAFLSDLLANGTEKQRGLAISAFIAMLETGNFSSSHNFDFGAHSRNYGWEPLSLDDMKEWYSAVFILASDLAKPGQPFRNIVRNAVAGHFRGLWLGTDLHSEITELMRQMSDSQGWPEGWVATRQTIRFDAHGMPAHTLEILKRLESELRPDTLEKNVRAYTFSKPWGLLDVAETEDQDDESDEATVIPAHERIAMRVEALGVEILSNEELLIKLLNDLLSDGSGNEYHFGVGIGKASSKVAERWSQFYAVYAQLEPDKRSVRFLAGFLEGAGRSHPEAVNRILDTALQDPELAEHFPELVGFAVDDTAGRKLLASIAVGKAPARSYFFASMRGGANGLSTKMFAEIVQRLSELPNGHVVALDALGMEIFARQSQKLGIPDAIVFLGRDLLASFDFESQDSNIAYRLDEIAKVCLSGNDAQEATKNFCTRLSESLEDYRSRADSFGKLACTLFKLQPDAALDAFLFHQKKTPLGYTILSRFSMSKPSVVNCAESSRLLAWVARDRAIRAPLLATEINILAKTDNTLAWSQLAADLLAMAPDRAAVLRGFESRFRPRSWSGNLAQILQPYIEMTSRLRQDVDAVVAEWAAAQLKALELRVAAESRYEREVDESFE